MNILVYGWIHPKNMIGINLLSKEGINFHFSRSDVTYDYLMPTDSFEIRGSYRKGVIFGPHIPLENVNACPAGANFYFNSLSPWLKKLSSHLFSGINFIDLHFPVDIEKFVPSDKKGKPVFYYKRRDEGIMKEFFSLYNMEDFVIYDYEKRYQEANFLQSISSAPYVVWLGCHESQGFALEETLSCNTPIFVIDSESLRDETGGYWDHKFPGEYLECTTASYFDSRCGILSDVKNWKEKFNIFKNQIYTYNPRDFVIEVLSPKACAEKWRRILNT